MVSISFEIVIGKLGFPLSRNTQNALVALSVYPTIDMVCSHAQMNIE